MCTFAQAMLSAVLLSTVALAQSNETALDTSPVADAYLVKYFANLDALSGAGNLVNLTNGGTVGGNDSTDYICANVYVFAQDQQLIACCTCPLSPNDLKNLWAPDLTGNTLTLGIPSGITVGLVATADYGPGICNAGVPGVLVPGLRAWGTTVHFAGGTSYLTETKFSQVGLGPSEYAKLTSYCGFIQQDGSGAGICNSCQPSASGAAKKN
jgi:CO/xanthine dehydrogenase FAD-binding subunit